MKWPIRCLWFAIFGIAMLGCGTGKSDLAVILQIEGNDIYIDELEQLGRVALSKSGLSFDTGEGQKRYKEIAPNLYESLIDIYVIKQEAEREGIHPTEEELESEVEKFKTTLRDAGQLDQFMNGLGVDEKRLRDSVEDMLAMNVFQQKILEEGKRDPTEEEIKVSYFKFHSEFRYPKRLRASHIFFKAGKDDDETVHARAKQRAEQVRKMIGDKPAETFVKLARRYSEDTGSAGRGGDLGFFLKKEPRVPDAFKKVAFSMKVGEVSDVVQTPLGYHIIWVTDHEQSLEEATPEIKLILQRQYMADYFKQWREKAREKTEIVRLFDPETYTVLTKEEAEKRAAQANTPKKPDLEPEGN